MKRLISSLLYCLTFIILFNVSARATPQDESTKSVSSILIAYETYYNLTHETYISQNDWDIADALESGYKTVKVGDWTVHYNSTTLQADQICVTLTHNMPFGYPDIPNNSFMLFAVMEYGIPREYTSEEFDYIEKEIGKIYDHLNTAISNTTFPVFKANPVIFYESDCGVYSLYSVSKNGIAIQLEINN